MTNKEMREVLRLHGMWLRREPSGVRANLGGSRLIGANFAHANLERAIFTHANLAYANLEHAIFDGANFAHANLDRASLDMASFNGANLYGCVGDSAYVGHSITNLAWPVWISPNAERITIGCQTHSYADWQKWTAKSKAISDMHRDAPAFWARHKREIMALAGSVRVGE